MPARVCPANTDAYCPANTHGWCSSDTVCPVDTGVPLTWTNPTITVDQSLVKAIDVQEARNYLQAEAVSCVCEQEACNYCSDCGYLQHVTGCTLSACNCDDHQSPECAGWYDYYVYNCATINVASGTPYESLPVGTRTAPWNCMCNFTPPGQSWSTYTPPHAPGKAHPDWGCMCNPFSWGV